MLETHPERVVQRAVAGMLPEGVLGHRLNGKLKVYTGSEHPHVAQTPQQYSIAK
jgi:large subunit ribosomal protein L13